MTVPDRRPSYSRVYWTIVDDEKFENVYDDDATLGVWLKLLLIADQAWPASAHIPANSRPKAVKILAGAGLIHLQAGGRYRVAGLDAERERRSGEQVNGGIVRARTGQRGPGGRYLASDHQVNSSGGPAVDSSGGRPAVDPPATSSDETSRDETRRDEGDARADDVPAFTKTIDYLEERTARPWLFRPGAQTWETLWADVRDFGSEAVIRAMDAVKQNHPDHGQLVFGASRSLHAIEGPKPLTKDERERAEARRALGLA